MKKNMKKRVISGGLCGVILVGAGAGVYQYANSSGSAISVYAVNEIAMDEMFSDESNIYGTVTYDKMQAVYLSDTQDVTKVFVSEGDTVKKGDVLLEYDSTLSDIDLERKEIDLAKLKLQQQEMEKEVTTGKRSTSSLVDSYEPGEYSADDDYDDTEASAGYAIGDSGVFMTAMTGAANALTYVSKITTEATQTSSSVVSSGTSSSSVVEEQEKSNVPDSSGTSETEKDQPSSSDKDPSSTDKDKDQPSSEDKDKDKDKSSTASESSETKESSASSSVVSSGSSSDIGSGSGSVGSSSVIQEDKKKESKTVKTYRVIGGKGTKKKPLFVILAQDYKFNEDMLNELDLRTGKNYVIFLTTEKNRTDGEILSQDGLLCVKGLDGTYSYQFFDASGYEVPNRETEDIDDDGGDYWDDYGGGYDDSEDEKLTSEEIAEVKQQLKEINLDIKMAELELKKMKDEVNNHQVVASVSGTVSSVLDEDEASSDGSPIIKISGGGSYYIDCAIDEYDYSTIREGDSVTVSSYETGEVFTGTIDSIGDTPTSNYDNYSSNPNISYYPFVVSVGIDADMSEGEYCGITLDGSSEEMTTDSDSLYLSQMFVLDEGTKHYVYVRGEDGQLEKREIKIGNIQYSMVQILGNLTMDDWVAFPYGKGLKDGADCVETSTEELYNY